MDFTKNFYLARNIVKGCLFVAMGLCIIGLIVNEALPAVGMYIVIGAVGLIIVALALIFTCLKCPYCGKQIISKCLTVTVCPHCKRDLATGLKAKGKKRR